MNLRELVLILRHGVSLQGDLRHIFDEYSDAEEINFEQFMSSITNTANERKLMKSD